MQVGLVNPFQLNGMETQPPAVFRGTGPAVKNFSLCQTHAKGAFDPLTHHKKKQL